VEIRFALIDDIIGLREAINITGTDRDTPYFFGDHEDSTRHIGVFDESCCIG